MYLLHLTYPSRRPETLTFTSPFLRALYMITLTAQPVAMALEDREAA